MSCPDTHPDVICQLCGIHYYPGECERRCNAHFKRWLKTEPEVQKLHEEYLKGKAQRQEAEKKRVEEQKKYSRPLRVINGASIGREEMHNGFVWKVWPDS